ncbi:MAG: hypothetical protein N2559_15385 [Anaerolineae bacterium]|nr:hypothetical protein [Anaerolineae bacterium]
MRAQILGVTMLAVLALVLLMMSSPGPVLAADCVSAGSGNWSSASTWTGCNSEIPQDGDNVAIASGHIVTVNITTSHLASVTVNGTLRFDNSGTGKTMTITGDLTVNNGGVLGVATGGSATTHLLVLGGDLTNNGTINCLPSTGRALNFMFNRNGNQTVSGSGAMTRFNNITLDMGNSHANTLDVLAVISMTVDGLTLNNGTFKLSSASTLTPFSGGYTITSTAGYHLNHPNAVSDWGSSGSLSVQGALTITAGAMTVGSAAGNELEIRGPNARVQISGGTLNITGRWVQVSGGNSNVTNIAGGVVNVATIGHSNNSDATFQVPAGNNFSMSGGVVAIKNANGGTAGDLRITNSNASITGGTFVIGNGNATSGNIKIQSTPSLHNLTIDASATTTPTLAADLTVNGTLTLNSNLDTVTRTLTLGSTSTVTGTGDVVGSVRRAHPFNTNTNYQFNNAQTLVAFNSVTNGASPSLTINLSKSAPPGLTTAVPRLYAITATNISNYNATLQLGYQDTETSGMTEANLRAWRHNGTRWVLQPGSVDTTNNYVSATNVTAFSDWAITDNGAPTAVMLSTFDARTDAPNALPLVTLGALAVIVLGASVWRRRR